MKYKLNLCPKLDVSAPPVTGALVGAQARPAFVAWQPSTWPAAPTAVDDEFIHTLKRIFEDSILGEISNVIADVLRVNGNLQHRGHVVAISLMCALDAISSYGYCRKNGKQIPPFICAHFPCEYHPYADEIRNVYRNTLVHSWNLFEAAIYPDDTDVKSENGTIGFGLLNFFEALVQATENFLETLPSDANLQKNTLHRYSELRGTARA